MTEHHYPAVEGFEILSQGLGFNDQLAPIYLQTTETGIRTALIVQPGHLNPMGICHGGVILSFADFAMAALLAHRLQNYSGMPTINMNVDFIAPGKVGDWLEFKLDRLSTTRLMGNVAGVLEGPNGVVARVNGIYRLPKAPE